MEIKSTTNNWPFMSWKLHQPWWKWFLGHEWCFLRRFLQKQDIKKTIVAVNRKNRRWRKNIIAWIGFLWDEHQKIFKQNENNAMIEQKTEVKAVFMRWKTFYTWWMQFSCHVLRFHHGENAFMNFCLYIIWKKNPRIIWTQKKLYFIEKYSFFHLSYYSFYTT